MYSETFELDILASLECLIQKSHSEKHYKLCILQKDCESVTGVFAIAHTLFKAIRLFWQNITQIQKSKFFITDYLLYISENGNKQIQYLPSKSVFF